MGLWTVFSACSFRYCGCAGATRRERAWTNADLGPRHSRLLSGVVGLRYEVRGGENWPLTPGPDHRQPRIDMETLAALVLFPDVAIVTKQELLSIPIMGWYLRRSPMIMIDRDDGRKALRASGARTRGVGGGRSVLIFPEGRSQADRRTCRIQALAWRSYTKRSRSPCCLSS